MKKESSAEPCFSIDAGGPVARRAVDIRAGGPAPVPPEDGKSCLSPVLRNSEGAAGLWLWVGTGFLLLLVAWVVLFTVARSAKIESVPLSTSGGATR